MRFSDEPPFSDADLARARQVAVSPRIFAVAWFEGVRAVCVFREFYLKPLLQGLLRPTPRERALIDLHYRMVPLAVALLRLGSPLYFQSIAASARALFELAMDMALVAEDKTDEAAERLAAFTRVERYCYEERVVAFYNGRPNPDDLDLAGLRARCADAALAAEINALLLRVWGLTPHPNTGTRQYPRHWSRYGDAAARAQHLGWTERYVRSYKRLSWHMHGGRVGTEGLPRDVFDIFAAEAYGLATDVMRKSYTTLGRELHLAAAAAEWDELLTGLERIVGLALVDTRLVIAGEPGRLRYLEEREDVWLRRIESGPDAAPPAA